MTQAEVMNTSTGVGSPPRIWVGVTFDTVPTVGGQTHVFRGVCNMSTTVEAISLRNAVDGSDVVFPVVPVGGIIYGLFTHVNTTGTTATAGELRGFV